MSEGHEPAAWANERACSLANAAAGYAYIALNAKQLGPFGKALALYIEQHEQQPVDPDLLIARDSAATEWDSSSPDAAKKMRDGECDDYHVVKSALRAVKFCRAQATAQ